MRIIVRYEATHEFTNVEYVKGRGAGKIFLWLVTYSVPYCEHTITLYNRIN